MVSSRVSQTSSSRYRLQSAKVIGVAEFGVQLFQDGKIRPGFRPKLAFNMASKVVYHPVVIKQRVIDIEEEYNFVEGFTAFLLILPPLHDDLPPPHQAIRPDLDDVVEHEARVHRPTSRARIRSRQGVNHPSRGPILGRPVPAPSISPSECSGLRRVTLS